MGSRKKENNHSAKKSDIKDAKTRHKKAYFHRQDDKRAASDSPDALGRRRRPIKKHKKNAQLKQKERQRKRTGK